MPVFSWNSYYVTLGLLAVCTIVGMSVAIRFHREVDEDLAPTTAKDLLDPLEKAFHTGLMHPSEIERIRELVKTSNLAKMVPSKTSAKPVDQGTGLTAIGDSHFAADGSVDQSSDGGHQADVS